MVAGPPVGQRETPFRASANWDASSRKNWPYITRASRIRVMYDESAPNPLSHDDDEDDEDDEGGGRRRSFARHFPLVDRSLPATGQQFSRMQYIDLSDLRPCTRDVDCLLLTHSRMSSFVRPPDSRKSSKEAAAAGAPMLAGGDAPVKPSSRRMRATAAALDSRSLAHLDLATATLVTAPSSSSAASPSAASDLSWMSSRMRSSSSSSPSSSDQSESTLHELTTDRDDSRLTKEGGRRLRLLAALKGLFAERERQIFCSIRQGRAREEGGRREDVEGSSIHAKIRMGSLSPGRRPRTLFKRRFGVFALFILLALVDHVEIIRHQGISGTRGPAVAAEDGMGGRAKRPRAP